MSVLLYVIVGMCIFLQAERGIFDTLYYFRLFQKLKKVSLKNYPISKTNKKKVYVLIPVLKEQTFIEETLMKLCKIEHPDFEILIIIVTAIREELEKFNVNLLTTKQFVIRSLRFGALSKFKERIHVCEDPNPRGNMATQLNYAIKEIQAIAPSATPYIVYNADSVISQTTFVKLLDLLEEYPDREFVFQQPCAFVKDMRPTSPAFLNALSLYQSWYCLGHESRLINKYALQSKKNLLGGKENNTRLGIIIGHGSGMTLGLHAKYGGYPTDLLTEDLTFGFILSAHNAPILSLFALEIADVPSKFPIFIRQKSIWFWNYLGYISCYKKMRKQRRSFFQLVPLLFQGIGAGAYWFFSALFILAPILLGLLFASYEIIFLSIVSTILFYIIPQYILLKKLPNILENQGFLDIAENVKSVPFIKIFFPLCLIVLTDSIGPWIATLKSFRYFLTGELPKKPKTVD